MSAHKRRLLKLSRLWRCCYNQDDLEPASQQYRIPPKSERIPRGQKVTTFVENTLIHYTMWNYRTTFSRSIFGFGALYLLLVHLFALALWGFVVINQRRRGTLCLDGWLLESGVRNYVSTTCTRTLLIEESRNLAPHKSIALSDELTRLPTNIGGCF